jgi:hypothetical protein
MSVQNPFRWLKLLAVVIAIGSLPLAFADEKSLEKSKEPQAFDVAFADNGGMRLLVEVDKVELETPYGKLQIPTREIRSIDFAIRLSEAEQKRLDAAIFNLGSSDFAMREEATRTLMDLGIKAYAPLLKAAKHADLEVAHRAQELAVKLRNKLGKEDIEPREYDIVDTEHSRIAGKIAGDQISVRTSQFGTQQLKLTDVRSLTSAGSPRVAEVAIDVQDDPGNLLGMHGSIGKTFAFRVTGRIDGSVYGTGIYTTDSSLATAAVHAGVLKSGETGVVRVTMINSPAAFTATSQNGVTSYPWGPYPAAYQIHIPKKK